MPVYEYECQSCQEVTESWQNISDEPLKECPACKGELKKIISRSSFQLKGGGWFADGYNNSSSCKAGDCKPSSEAGCSKGKSPECKAC